MTLTYASPYLRWRLGVRAVSLRQEGVYVSSQDWDLIEAVEAGKVSRAAQEPLEHLEGKQRDVYIALLLDKGLGQ